MSELVVVGVDPGPMPGICALYWLSPEQVRPASAVYQCNHPAAVDLVEHLLNWGADRRVLAIERFVSGPRSSRLNSPISAQITRELITALTSLRTTLACEVVLRSAAEVKPWGSDERLDACGLIETTRGMPHARDAARHALHAAVWAAGQVDPLGSLWRSGLKGSDQGE